MHSWRNHFIFIKVRQITIKKVSKRKEKKKQKHFLQQKEEEEEDILVDKFLTVIEYRKASIT